MLKKELFVRRANGLHQKLLMMKLTSFLLLVCFLQVSAGGYSQSISISLRKASIEKVFQLIEKQSEYRFFYNEKLLRNSRKITLDIKDGSLKTILDVCFKDQPYSYVIDEKQIIIKQKEFDLATEVVKPKPVQITSVEVKGRIISEAGVALSGATIKEKGTSNVTTSNANGYFTIEVADAKAVLVISYVGYKGIEVSTGGKSDLSIKLSLLNASLSEIVMVGYGSRKKSNYTGAVSTVATKEIVAAPVADISNALTGRLSGLIAVQRNGEPGRDGSNLLIRGVSTTGDNSPLVVIDGIPRGDFSQLDPNEIETITLLKDPASAAVFGVRAANGVILVTTKRGKVGKSSLSFSVRSDWQKPTILPKYMDSYNYAKLLNEGSINAGTTPPFSQADLDAYKNGTDRDAYPNTDWIKATLKNYAPQQQYNVSLNGGTEKTRYFISLGHVNQSGLYANSNFGRYNFRSNIDVDATATTRISLDVSGRMEDRNAPSDPANQLLYYALYAPPIFPAVFSNGLPGSFPSGRNPAERAKNGGYSKNNSNTLFTNFTITQQLPFVKGLSLKGVFAYDRSFTSSKTWLTPYTVYTYNKTTKAYIPINGDGINTTSLSENFDQGSSLTMEAHLNYQRTFGKHEVSGLFLYTQNTGTYNYLSGFRDNFLSNAIDQLFAGSDANQQTSGGANVSGRQGYVGRVNYVFANKYLFEGNFRYDGSFNFAPGRKWGFFPSFSAGWKISEEDFFKNAIHAVDYLKIRGSYGILGNDRIEPYRYLSSYQYDSGYPFGDAGSLAINKGLSSTGIPDPNTTWETAKSVNIGFDGSMWNRKLNFEFDWFHKRTSDILGQRSLSVPATFGDILPLENLNIVDNSGIEFSLGYENKISKDINYFIKGNFTYAHNKIIFQDEPTSVDPNQKRTGRSIDQFFGLKAIGYFNSQAEIDKAPVQPNPVKPGDIRYADINGDGVIDNKDVVPIGLTPIPQIIYGISGGISYKNFDVNFLFQGATKVSAYLTGELAWPFYNGAKSLVDQANYWTPQNTGAKYPRITDVPTANNIAQSSFWLKDASYLRLKNIQVGYNLSKNTLAKLKMSAVRIFVSGQNLLTFSKLKVTDPEGPGDNGTNFQGNSSRGWFYPQQKVIAVGVNVTF
jgi:TonB-linked SusC/RagA family outer membrane protein